MRVYNLADLLFVAHRPISAPKFSLSDPRRGNELTSYCYYQYRDLSWYVYFYPFNQLLHNNLAEDRADR